MSVLIGGAAGFGIDRAGNVLGRLLNRLGYRIYIHRDYPSLIRGGHTFSIIRASREKISAFRDTVDAILAMNQETFERHKDRLKENGILIYDSKRVNVASNPRYIGLPLDDILKEEKAPEVMRNTCIIGAFAKAVGMEFDVLEEVIRKEFTKETELNVKVAKRGFGASKELMKLDRLDGESLPILTGNQAVALGLIKGGLDAYISYPMTPTSPVLHYLASVADRFGIDVIHPENEISVILMALGYAYAGKKAAVGTSGGGFCLMTEGLSLSGMAELPVTIVLGQRPGPSTGLPTYSSQTDVNFALSAGHGEFVRLVVAPGDAEEAYRWSAIALGLSWKYQIPSIILSDKELGESVFNLDPNVVDGVEVEEPLLWDGRSPYKRYLNTETGISPLAFPSTENAVIKVNSYEHDEFGITTEDPELTTVMQDKRLRKKQYLVEDLKKLDTVNVYGERDSEIALLCWGSNKGTCVEIGNSLGMMVVQPVVFEPFPLEALREALSGVKRVISVENNATGQLANLVRSHGFKVDEEILRYDGRPFSIEDLEKRVKEVIS